jgi:sugar lactone lactonase YvrE
MALDFRPLVEPRFHGGEGPVWDDRRGLVFFVDMSGPRVHAVGLDGTGLRGWDMPELPASLALGESGRLVVALPHRLMLLDPDSGALSLFAAVPDVPAHARLNDGKTGPDGAFWVGSMDLRPEREKIGRLYRVTGDARVERVLDACAITSNGLAWTADGRRMFHSDSRGMALDLWDFDAETGRPSNRRRIAAPDEATGRPDGGACDAEGVYWSAGVSAGRLNLWSAEGRLLAQHPTPAPAPSMPCFCGPGLRRLVVTSLTPDAHRDNPASGMLMIADAPVAGAPVRRMAGV